MNLKFRRLLILSAVAGLLGGLAMRRFTWRDEVSQTASFGDTAHSASEVSKAAAAGRAAQTAPRFAPRHSSDTLETLAVLDDTHCYARLALWMMDASEADIARFWSGYSKKEKRSKDISDLVFINWTRLDPQAAIAAVAGTPDARYAWWAWSCHDPDTALTAALAADPESVGYVARGLGEFHPEWLRLHLKELPVSARAVAMDGLAKWDDRENPLETLEFMMKNDGDPGKGTIKALVRQDPWAAMDWVKRNPGNEDPFASVGDRVDLVIETMASERPDDLERLTALTPSGKTRLKMESALFANLLKADPAAALEQAKSSTVPRTAAERYAAIGLSVVQADPEQALDLATSLFSACPDVLHLCAKIEHPGGSVDSYLEIPDVQNFMKALMAKAPAELMDIAIARIEHPDVPFSQLSLQWAEHDLGGFTEWVNRQPDGEIRNKASNVIADNLSDGGHFAEAAEWAASTDLSDTGELDEVLTDWMYRDPEAPGKWLESSNLPPDTKAIIQYILKRPR